MASETVPTTPGARRSSTLTDLPPISIEEQEQQTDAGNSYGSFPTRDGLEAMPQPSKPTKPSTRALAPDLLRGFLMLVMALDHTALALNTWEHGTGSDTEMDGTVIKQWNRPAAYIVRTLTHLCASGFTMLLGMGVVYLGRSRTRLGWSSLRIARYFAVRTAVLTMIGVLLGLAITGGKVWFVNFVLFSLAIDYLLAGLLWLVMYKTEPLLARAVSCIFPDKVSADGERGDEPLLNPRGGRVGGMQDSEFGTRVSWHAHNGLLAILALVTIWWNIWLSPTHGFCEVKDDTSHNHLEPFSVAAAGGPEGQDGPAVSHNPLLGIWFWVTVTERVMSFFPPMAWLSFAILGLLYGRIDVARTWSARVASLCNIAAGLGFVILFVLTRVLHFGNLSEGCLQTPEHDKYPNRNPYLVSVQSFFYIIKYPPDVAFWAFTLAGNFFLLAFFGGIPTGVAKRFTLLLDFGRAALFFYLVHLFFVFILGALMVRAFGHDTGQPEQMKPGSTRGIDNLFGYFGIWALIMLMIWPLTRWYSRFKGTKSADSIWRFF
ncbi:hypothetical protein FZEAL_7676 [Fusarium zealandicum]|uniref:Heparan-alpha-glucosaminide N-acetyltransferase catalytic domain-containing protein n=1 Tax=Fusarium zealandicum TaxID=1053134 RepID=A0A8H4XIA1_9HYPO|nr:hypothetical protein FZEAL_7676 [Fusarium zealandicum]